MGISQADVADAAERAGYTEALFDDISVPRQSWRSGDGRYIVAFTYHPNAAVSVLKSTTGDDGWADTLIEGPLTLQDPAELVAVFTDD